MNEELPPCTPNIEGVVRVLGGQVVECHNGEWQVIVEEGPPAHIWVDPPSLGHAAEVADPEAPEPDGWDGDGGQSRGG